MQRLCELVDIEVNNEHCVIFKVKDSKMIEMASLGCFLGNEDMIRMTKGRTPEITVFRKNGTTYSYHFGEVSTTLISENLRNQREMIRECAILDYGIVCDLSYVSCSKTDQDLINSTVNVTKMKDAKRNIEVVSGGGMVCNIRINEKTLVTGINVTEVKDWFEKRGYKVSFDKDITQGMECGVVRGKCKPISKQKSQNNDKINKSLDDTLMAAKDKATKENNKNVSVKAAERDERGL